MTPPLELAGNALSGIYGCQAVPYDGFSIGMVFPNNNHGLPPFEIEIEWKPRIDALHIGLGVQYDLSPLAHPERIALLLENSVEPFLEGICEAVAPGRLGLYLEPDGDCVPCYDAIFGYAPLQEDEIVSKCRGVIVRGSRMLMLLSSTFSCIEKGYTPNADERMSLLQIEYGRWEVEGLSSDVPQNGSRLPKRLFGGVGTLAAQ